MASSSSINQPFFKGIDHIGIVVKDLDKTVRNFSVKFGIGPWSIFECGPENISDMQVDGKKTEYRFRIAICNLAGTGIELIQPLDNKSIYADFLSGHGENLHHIGYLVDDYDKSLDFFDKKGIKRVMSGNLMGHNRFSYLDATSKLKHYIDISQADEGFFSLETNKFGLGKIVEPKPANFYPATVKELPMKPVFEKIGQVAFVVKNVDELVQLYSSEYGIGPWRIWEFGPETVFGMTVEGKKKDYRMRLGITRIGDTDLELIQPRDEASIYYNFLKIHGEGFHHLAYLVSDYGRVMSYLETLAIKISMSGVWFGKHTWVYLDTENYLKHIVELNYTEPGFDYPPPLKYMEVE